MLILHAFINHGALICEQIFLCAVRYNRIYYCVSEKKIKCGLNSVKMTENGLNAS